MKIHTFWIIVGISVALLAFNNAEAKTIFEVADNIIENPSAEEVLVDSPDKWNLYVGNGTFEFGFTEGKSAVE